LSNTRDQGDRGALQAAMYLGLEWGGWAPKGWRAENETIPPLYRKRMQEHASANYLGRTRRNVIDSHATLIRMSCQWHLGALKWMNT
jgi:hypothetical protein